MFRLIALDLDGTLLDNNKRVSKENIEVLNKLIFAGYEVVIATGRRYYSAKKLTQDINSHKTIIANNGNIVRRTEDDKILFARYMDKADFRYIIDEGRKRELFPVIHVDYFHEGYDMIIEKGIKHFGDSMHLLKEEKRMKVIPNDLIYDIDKVLAVVYVGDRHLMEEFYYHINSNYPDRYSSHVMENIDIAEAMFEIMNPMGNKWLSILEYAKSLGIKPEEIIAIGDDNNDLQMILNAGLGIAMRNGTDLVKEAANIITEYDNNNSGVAFVLKRVLNIK